MYGAIIPHRAVHVLTSESQGNAGGSDGIKGSMITWNPTPPASVVYHDYSWWREPEVRVVGLDLCVPLRTVSVSVGDPGTRPDGGRKGVGTHRACSSQCRRGSSNGPWGHDIY